MPDSAFDRVKVVAKLSSCLEETKLDWRKFVEQRLYTPLGIPGELASLNLESPGPCSAKNRDLVIATALSASDTTLRNVVASTGSGDRIFGSADPSLEWPRLGPWPCAALPQIQVVWSLLVRTRQRRSRAESQPRQAAGSRIRKDHLGGARWNSTFPGSQHD